MLGAADDDCSLLPIPSFFQYHISYNTLIFKRREKKRSIREARKKATQQKTNRLSTKHHLLILECSSIDIEQVVIYTTRSNPPKLHERTYLSSVIACFITTRYVKLFLYLERFIFNVVYRIMAS
jgi:hypothetical protein